MWPIFCWMIQWSWLKRSRFTPLICLCKPFGENSMKIVHIFSWTWLWHRFYICISVNVHLFKTETESMNTFHFKWNTKDTSKYLICILNGCGNLTSYGELVLCTNCKWYDTNKWHFIDEHVCLHKRSFFESQRRDLNAMQ